jgi:hypothetical protein
MCGACFSGCRKTNQQKHFRVEAIKLLNDWSTWILTLETAAIAGIYTGLKASMEQPPEGWASYLNIPLVLSAICLAASITMPGSCS